MIIIAGTTPTIEYTFDSVTVANITTAVFTIKQNGQPVIEKTLADATVGEKKISFTLSQAETLALSRTKVTKLYLDYVLNDGTRGAGITRNATIAAAGKQEVI